MSSINELRAKIDLRIHGDPDNYYEVTLWEEEVDLFCEDLNAGIQFITTICTDEELYWLGEVYDDIMEKTRSKAFIDALRERAERVDNKAWKAVILEDIRTAAEYLPLPETE